MASLASTHSTGINTFLDLPIIHHTIAIAVLLLTDSLAHQTTTSRH